jgi:hypothetical protein
VTALRLEDFYDTTPLEVLLTGGRHAGHRMLVPEPLPSFLLMPGDYTGGPVLPSTTVYCFTGSIRDDGTRVYEAQR